MMVRDYFAQTVEEIKHDRESQIYLVLFIVLIVGGGGYYGHRWYAVQRSQKAQQAYAASLDIYQQAMAMQFEPHAKAPDRTSLWEQVEVDTRHAIDQYGRSLYAPFFKAFLAQAQYYQTKRDGALVTMRSAVDSMSGYYRGLYQVTLDLMLLDGNADEKKQALADLDSLANNTKSRVQDMAFYYLGLYYGSTGDQKRAAEYFKKASMLPQPYPDLAAAQSPWQQLALHKLTELGADER